MLHRSLRGPAALAVAVVAASAFGCSGGGEKTADATPGAAQPPPAPRRPEFLCYEATGRKVLTDALGKETDEPVRIKVWASRQAMRSQEQPDGPVDIMRLDRKAVWRLDPARRTYGQATFGEYAAQVDMVRRLLAKQLSDPELPAAQRRSLEVALGQRQPKVSVQADEETVEILGRRCRHVRYYEDDRLRIEEWAAEDISLPCDLGELRALSGDFSRELLKRLDERRGLGLKTRVYGRLPTRPRIEEREITSLETPEKLEASLFEVPQGYTRDDRPAAR